MPWLAIPFAERDLAARLGDLFGVRGIPTLVLLDEQVTAAAAGAA